MKAEDTKINSCGRKGCDSDRITLPYGRKPIHVSGKVHGKRNDTKAVPVVINVALDTQLAKAA